jgi:putative Holliday junction resolvase
MNGEESDSSRGARTLAGKLEKKVSFPIVLHDERMSTSAAEKFMLEADVSRKKRKEKIDAVAASVILQNYLDMTAGNE